MVNYEVNDDTVAVIGIDKKNSKVIEKKEEYIINNNGYEVMDYSCQYFGSSYSGRVNGSKKMLGANYKLPIIVEESSNLIFFPISSPEDCKCIWISLKWYQNTIERGKSTYIVLKNNKKIKCSVSTKSIQNQVLRASRLQLILNDRKLGK